MVSDPEAPMSSTVTRAPATVWTVTVKARSTTAVADIPMTSVRMTDQSARRPPISVPTVMPTPNSASATGTAEVRKPETSTSVGVM